MAFNWFKKLKTGLSKSAQKVEKAFTSVIGKKKLDESSLTEIEDQLISSDLGVNASIKIVDKLRNHKFELTSKNKEISKEMVLHVVKDELNKILLNSEKSLFNNNNNDKPHVILLIGVNGSGKTTTAGKIASMLKEKDKNVVIAACDTFRAAAVEQLEQWASRTKSIFVRDRSTLEYSPRWNTISNFLSNDSIFSASKLIYSTPSI